MSNIAISRAIPVYNAVIDNAQDGIMAIALVDLPAVESDFIHFQKQEEPLKFAVQDEEQHMLTGVVMRAGFPIYRCDNGYEYYIVYSRETVKQMAEKMMKDNTFNNINIMHNGEMVVDGVNLVELFIKDKASGISPRGFDNIEDGSLFATYKVSNEEIWQSVKAGTFKGFSLEGYFSIEPVTLRDRDRNKNTYEKMSNFIDKLIKRLIKCGSMTLADGRELFWVGESDLQVGDELFYNTDTEEAVKAEDGTYELEDGTEVTVEGGVVSAIKEKDGDSEDSLDNEVEEVMEDTSDVQREEEPMEDSAAEIDELKAEIDSLKTEIDAIKSSLEELLQKPAAEPIVEEFSKASGTKADGGIPQFGSRAKSFHRN